MLWWESNYNDIISIHCHTSYCPLDPPYLPSTPHTSHTVSPYPGVRPIFGGGRKAISHHGDEGGWWLIQTRSVTSVTWSAGHSYVLLELHVEHQSPRLAQRYIGISWHGYNQLNWQKLTQGEKINFQLFPPSVCLPVLATSCARKCSEIRKTEAGKVLQKMTIIIVLHHRGYHWLIELFVFQDLVDSISLRKSLNHLELGQHRAVLSLAALKQQSEVTFRVQLQLTIVPFYNQNTILFSHCFWIRKT